MMNGWANYFCLGPVSKAYRAVDRHTCKRLRQWLCAKHKRQDCEPEILGRLPAHRFGLSGCGADAQLSVGEPDVPPEPDALMRLSGSTSGMWKRSMAWIVRHRANERAGNRQASLTTAPHLDSTAGLGMPLRAFRCAIHLSE